VKYFGPPKLFVYAFLLFAVICCMFGWLLTLGSLKVDPLMDELLDFLYVRGWLNL
jgi:hypothetical protein